MKISTREPAELLARRYPAIDVAIDALYVDEGRIVTSAGSAAGLDMMLHLVRRDHGARIANIVAQRLVIPPHRAGDQAQFVPRPMMLQAGFVGIAQDPQTRAVQPAIGWAVHAAESG